MENLGTSAKKLCPGSASRTELASDAMALVVKRISHLSDYYRIDSPKIVMIPGGFIWRVDAYLSEIPLSQADKIFVNTRQRLVQLNVKEDEVPPIKLVDGGVYARFVKVQGEDAVEYSNLFLRPQ